MDIRMLHEVPGTSTVAIIYHTGKICINHFKTAALKEHRVSDVYHARSS